MDPGKKVLDDSGRGDHLVQFYSTPEMLAETVAHFIGEGLRKGETVISIATPGHRALFDTVAADAGTDLPAARREGRLVELDAADTLARFMSAGQPVWERFEATIGPVLAKAAARLEGARAYGEMVDVLWQAGNLSAAMRLEGYWNQILVSRHIPLFCSYRADMLADAEDHSQLEHILHTHSHLVPAHGELEKAVDRAIAETFGEAGAQALRPLIAATQTAGAKLPWAEAAIFWLKNNLPDRADRVVGRARVILEGAAV